MTKKPSPYGAKKFQSIDEYHQSFPPEIQVLLGEIREIIRKSAPDAVETISYNMPAFKMKKVLVYYAANKNHIGFYPTPKPIQAFADELRSYKTSKGAIQFPIDEKLPSALIAKMVRYRVEDEINQERQKQFGKV